MILLGILLTLLGALKFSCIPNKDSDQFDELATKYDASPDFINNVASVMLIVEGLVEIICGIFILTR